jgi:hypothetical protein
VNNRLQKILIHVSKENLYDIARVLNLVRTLTNAWAVLFKRKKILNTTFTLNNNNKNNNNNNNNNNSNNNDNDDDDEFEFEFLV